MSFNKITTSDLTNKGVSGLPDTPGLSASEMQRKFDEIGKEVIVPKFNELVDELNKNGNVIKASDIVGIRVNANKQIEVTTDFNSWYATASSGHVVIDKNGNTLPQRGTMKFVGESLVYDDPEHEQTVISAIQGVQGEEGPIGPVGPKGDRGQVYIPSIDEQGNISWTPADYTVPPAVRNIRGPQGVQGVQGPRGERGYNGKDGRSFTVLGQYESLEALQIAHPVGNEGDAYSVQLAEGNTIYLWDVDKREWVDIGSLQGPQGPQGEQGIQGIQGPPGIQGERGIPTSVNGLIGESIEVTPAVIPYTESKSLADLLGTTDISKYSDGTVTGAIKSACDKADANEAAIADVNSKLGNTDISAIGDGTLTGGLDALNSNLVFNNIYKHRDLGTITSSNRDEWIAKHINSDGTFNNIYVGDVVTIQDGTYNAKWVVAGFDTEYNKGDTPLQNHHISLIPQTYLFTAPMNDTNTTEGGYAGSKMHTSTLVNVANNLKNALGSHLLERRVLLSNSTSVSIASGAGAGWTGASNGWSWYSAYCTLLSEVQVYGSTICSSSFFDVGEGCSQLPLFKFVNHVYHGSFNFWLRAVVSSTSFADATGNGIASNSNASGAYAVRPLITIG